MSTRDSISFEVDARSGRSVARADPALIDRDEALEDRREESAPELSYLGDPGLLEVVRESGRKRAGAALPPP